MENQTGDAITGAAIIATASALAGATGLDPLTLMFAAAGGVWGEPAAAELGRIRKISLYFTSVLAGALMGTLAARTLHGGDEAWRHAWAFGSTAGFHLFMAALFAKIIPTLVDVLTARLMAGLRGLFGGDK